MGRLPSDEAEHSDSGPEVEIPMDAPPPYSPTARSVDTPPSSSGDVAAPGGGGYNASNPYDNYDAQHNFNSHHLGPRVRAPSHDYRGYEQSSNGYETPPPTFTSTAPGYSGYPEKAGTAGTAHPMNNPTSDAHMPPEGVEVRAYIAPNPIHPPHPSHPAQKQGNHPSVRRRHSNSSLSSYSSLSSWSSSSSSDDSDSELDLPNSPAAIQRRVQLEKYRAHQASLRVQKSVLDNAFHISKAERKAQYHVLTAAHKAARKERRAEMKEHRKSNKDNKKENKKAYRDHKREERRVRQGLKREQKRERREIKREEKQLHRALRREEKHRRKELRRAEIDCVRRAEERAREVSEVANNIAIMSSRRHAGGGRGASSAGSAIPAAENIAHTHGRAFEFETLRAGLPHGLPGPWQGPVSLPRPGAAAHGYDGRGDGGYGAAGPDLQGNFSGSHNPNRTTGWSGQREPQQSGLIKATDEKRT